MDADTYIEAIERNGRRLLEAAGTDLTARIPACPDWDTRALVIHTGQVHGWVTGASHASRSCAR